MAASKPSPAVFTSLPGTPLVLKLGPTTSHSRSLSIPSWSTPFGTGEQGSYLPPIEGGTQVDAVRGVAVDAAGNAYITGDTYSPAYPGALPPPYPYPSLTFPSPNRMFVAKIKPDGQFAYVTLFDAGAAAAIAIDGAGNAYITGNAGGNISTAPVSLHAGPACSPSV